MTENVHGNLRSYNALFFLVKFEGVDDQAEFIILGPGKELGVVRVQRIHQAPAEKPQDVNAAGDSGWNAQRMVQVPDRKTPTHPSFSMKS